MKIDAKKMLAEVRANIDALDGCPLHKFNPEHWRPGKPVTCTQCGGHMPLTRATAYMAGYKAAGGDSNDIWPGYGEK